MSSSSTSPSNDKIAIVIGSGLAGLAASSELLSQNKNIDVYLLEQLPRPGGNSIKASSGINGAGTSYQISSKPPIVDRVGNFYEDLVKSAGEVMKGKDVNEIEERENLIRVLSEESKGAVEWLGNKGVDLSTVAKLGGHSIARTHRGGEGAKPPGAAIIGALLEELRGDRRWHLMTCCRATRILTDPETGMARGVVYFCADENEAEYGYTQADAAKYPREQLFGPLIFATGGFAGDGFGLLARYRPDLEGFPSTNEPRLGTLDLLIHIGAATVDLEQVQVHPTAFVDPNEPENLTKFLAAEMLRGEGGVLMRGGRRFVDELENRKVVTDKILTGEAAKNAVRLKQWNVQLVLDEGVYEKAKSHIDFYLWKGLMRKCRLAEANLGDEAQHTLQRYADAVFGKREDECGRTTFGGWKTETVEAGSMVYVGWVTPAVHFTMGGVRINGSGRVLGGNGEVLGNVWAVGEVSGGIHGDNRLGGSSLLECVVFGRRAGREVAKMLDG